MLAWYYPIIWRFMQNCGTHFENNVENSLLAQRRKQKFDATGLKASTACCQTISMNL